MTRREELIELNVHLNDDLDNFVGHVSSEYDIEEHESFVQVAKWINPKELTQMTSRLFFFTLNGEYMGVYFRHQSPTNYYFSSVFVSKNLTNCPPIKPPNLI